VTGLVSVSIILAVLGSLRRVPRRRDLTWLALGLVGGVVGQILLGAVTVANDLAPPFVMGHFLLSLVLVGNAVVLHARASDDRPVAVGRTTRRLTSALLPSLAVAVVAGTVVTGTGPHGGDENARRFGFEIESVTRVHSLAVIGFVGLLLLVLARAEKERAPAVFVQRARELLYVACGQAAIGWIQWFAGVPALLVGLHILGATLTWAACCRLVLSAGPAVAVVRDGSRVEALAGSA
jgi:cytochrome c oxidase assembly protein subunit 15